MTTRINLWASPRNLSTALMYSWRQRSDTTVVDEPLCGYWMALSGRDYPLGEATMAAQDTDGERVVQEVLLGPYDTDVVFFKQMGKHLEGLDWSFLTGFSNVLLTRPPADMVASFAKGVPDVGIHDTGYPILAEILDWLVANDQTPIVIESNQILADPPRLLTGLCQALDLEFDPAMLSWPPGPKPEDGPWAPAWYHRVWESTGWEQRDSRAPSELEPRLAAVAEEARPYYERLLPYLLKA